MAESTVVYAGNGTTTDYTVPFPYISRSHVTVMVNLMPQTEGVDYDWLNASTVRFLTAPVAQAGILLKRDTPMSSRLVDFQNGAVLTEEELNLAVKQLFYRLQELQDYYGAVLDGGLAAVVGGTATTTQDMIDAAVQQVITDPLLADLQSRINDIDTNAQAIIANANNITGVYTTIGGHDTRLDAVDLRFIPIEANQATFSSQIGTLQTENAAQATSITTLTANIGTNSAAIQSEATARADADSALSTRIDVLQAFANTIYVQPAAPTDPPTTLVVGDLWYDSDDGNHPYRWDGATWYSIRDGEFAVLAAQITSEQTARINADSAMASDISTIQATRNLDYALIVSNNQARIDGDAALTTSFNGLNTRMGTAEAAITSEQTTRASADTALAGDITSLYASTGANAAAISSETTARSNADSALSSSINAVSAVANAKNKSYRQATAPATGMVAGDIWFDSDDNNKAYRYDGTSWVATDDARIAANAAAIVTEQTARANADTAEANARIALAATVDANAAAIIAEQTARADADTAEANARIALAAVANAKTQTFSQATPPTAVATGDLWIETDNNNKLWRWSGSAWVDAADTRPATNAAAITAEQTARANGDSALAADISTLTTTVNGNTASISTHTSSINGLSAQYTVKVDVNGRVAGFGLASTPIDGVPTSSFIVIADKFAIVDPASTGSAPKVPFVVTGGVVYMQNVVVQDALIQNLTVTKLTTGTFPSGQTFTHNGDFNVGTTGKVRGGMTDYASGTGFYLGYSAGGYKFSVGDSSKYIRWDGTTLSIGGDIIASGNIAANAVTTAKIVDGDVSRTAYNSHTTGDSNPTVGVEYSKATASITAVAGKGVKVSWRVAWSNYYYYDDSYNPVVQTPGTITIKIKRNGTVIQTVVKTGMFGQDSAGWVLDSGVTAGTATYLITVTYSGLVPATTSRTYGSSDIVVQQFLR